MRTIARVVVGLVLAGGLSIAAALPAAAQQPQGMMGTQQMQFARFTMVGSPMSRTTFPFPMPFCVRRVVFVPRVFVMPTMTPMSSMMRFQLVRVVRMTPIVVCA